MPISFGDDRAIGWVDRIGQYLPEGHLVTFGQVYDIDGSKMSDMISVHSDHADNFVPIGSLCSYYASLLADLIDLPQYYEEFFLEV
jgi:hypothetical protein